MKAPIAQSCALIWHLCMALAFESKAAKYDSQCRVQENKSGLWTYKGFKAIILTFVGLVTKPMKKVMAAARSDVTSECYGVSV
jgi:hypothetical protein